MVIKRNKNKKIKPLKNGVFILPNIFTTANLFSGCFSIFCSIDENYELAAIAIFIAVFLDGLDGKVARAANAVSDFGKDYDSLSDLISFGAAPAILYYVWCSNTPGGESQDNIIWLISFFNFFSGVGVFLAANSFIISFFLSKLTSLFSSFLIFFGGA